MYRPLVVFVRYFDYAYINNLLSTRNKFTRKLTYYLPIAKANID
jgi:hypothetical protein